VPLSASVFKAAKIGSAKTFLNLLRDSKTLGQTKLMHEYSSSSEFYRGVPVRIILLQH